METVEAVDREPLVGRRAGRDYPGVERGKRGRGEVEGVPDLGESCHAPTKRLHLASSPQRFREIADPCSPITWLAGPSRCHLPY